MQWAEPLLGTRAEVEVLQGSQVVVEAEMAVLSEAERLEGIFSVFRETSDLCAFRAAGSTDSTELTHVMQLADDWVARSGGALNFCMQPLVDVWNAAEYHDELPSPQALEQARDQMGSPHSWHHLNLNAIAKGWIAEQALAMAFHEGGSTRPVDNGWLSLGGDLVHRGDESVLVGIENPGRPYDNVAPMATVAICNEALATSGGARRWWTIDGTRYPKVLDPRTGQPVSHIASATVIAADATTADALATAAIVLGVEESMRLAVANQAAVFIVASDGRVHASSERFHQAP